MIKLGVARKYSKNLVPYLNTLNSSSIKLYEMGFAFSIPSELPSEVLNYAKEHNTELTGHLPFYINFGNPEQIKKSIEYLKKGLIIANHLDSISVFHLGFYSKRNFQEIKKDIINGFKEVFELNLAKGYLGIETTGKQKAIGSYEEVLELIKELKDYRVIPIIDVAHMYARNNGKFPSTKEHFKKIIKDLKEAGVKKFYFHAGGIEYANGNEKKHATIKICEPPLAFLIEELESDNIDAKIIIESPASIEDIRWLRENKENFIKYTQERILKINKQSDLNEFFI